MKMRRVRLLLGLLALLLTACGGSQQQQPKSFMNVLTPDDSVSIAMANWVLMKYHSDKLSMDIDYPSFLVRQNVPDDEGLQEVFLWRDVSVSVIVDSLNGWTRSSGQMLSGMGAELVEVGDDYSIHTGVDDQWEFYAKIVERDPQRLVTVLLRYAPEHAEAMEQIKEWVRDF